MPSLKAEAKPAAMALLSQEGSTIETAVEIVRGVVPKPKRYSSGTTPRGIRFAIPLPS